jgi:hypothetical protein
MYGQRAGRLLNVEIPIAEIPYLLSVEINNDFLMIVIKVDVT